MAEFAYLTGWRVQSEVLPLEWRNVDLKAGIVTLDPGTTKNGEGRTIYLTAALRTLLEAQKAASEALAKTREQIARWCSIATASRSGGFYKELAESVRGGRLSGQAPARLPDGGPRTTSGPASPNVWRWR